MNDTAPRVAVIEGDGAGPELVAAACRVLVAAGVEVELVDVDLRSSGLDEATSILRTCVAVLKGPLATAQDGSERSLNIGLKQALGLHTQVRRIRSIGGLGPTGMDVHVVRQATEGLLAGIGAHAGPESAAIAELLGHPELAAADISIAWATAEATRLTFEVAVELARSIEASRLVLAQKAAAVPHRDGLFASIGRAVGESEGVEITPMAVDSVAARLVTHPTEFSVIVAPNLYGDILSDVAGAVAGSVALVAGVNLGDGIAVFEAAHGVVSRHAGRDTADPTGLILSAALLLDHLDRPDVARRVEGAVDDTVAAGITAASTGTAAFAAAVAERLA